MELQRLAGLASAVAGRRVDVQASRTGFAYTDGHTVYVTDKDNQAMLVGLLGQSALLAAGSLEPHIVRQFAGRRPLARRYVSLEVARAATVLDPCFPRRWARACTDHWTGALPASPSESLRRALSRERLPEPPEALGTILPGKLLRSGLSPGGTAVGANQGRIQARLQGKVDDEDEDYEESAILSLMMRFLSTPVSWESPLMRLLQDLLGIKRTPGSGRGTQRGGEELDMRGVAVAAERHACGVLIPDMPAPPRDAPAGPPADPVYPEWNWQTRSFRPDWTRVSECDPPPAGDTEPLPPLLCGSLRRRLGRLGLEYERKGRQPEGDSLDHKALVDLAVALRTGDSGDPRVYRASLRTARDLGVIVLLDASGSSHEQVNGARVWDKQRELAGLLVKALTAIGDRVAAYGFSSRGRHNVRFIRIKPFDGRFDQGALDRLQALQPSGFTRLGAAIRHAAHLLTTHAGTSRLLLVVVSDGFPHDEEYKTFYAEHDTRHALEEAVAQGVGCVCLSIGASTDEEMLERVWGNVTHASLDVPGDLDSQALSIFQSALRAAAPARRRSH